MTRPVPILLSFWKTLDMYAGGELIEDDLSVAIFAFWTVRTYVMGFHPTAILATRPMPIKVKLEPRHILGLRDHIDRAEKSQRVMWRMTAAADFGDDATEARKQLLDPFNDMLKRAGLRPVNGCGYDLNEERLKYLCHNLVDRNPSNGHEVIRIVADV